MNAIALLINLIISVWQACFVNEAQLKSIQMNAGAVMLTDCVYWIVIFPFLTIKDYNLNFVSSAYKFIGSLLGTEKIWPWIILLVYVPFYVR